MKEAPSQLRVEVAFLPTEAGGRTAAIHLEGYRPLAAAGRYDALREAESMPNAIFGVVLSGGSIVHPGESATATMQAPFFPEGLLAVAKVGTFTIFEPPRAVAHGRVLEGA